MGPDIIDFQSERGRHEELLGREDVLAELDALLRSGPPRGWVLVKGGPGMGKSALLAEWLKRREASGQAVPPHHFLRRGIEDWDRPDVVKRNLAAQVERLFPALADPAARPESRLRELLQRVSKEVLTPRQEQLVLVVDGLDEVEGEPDGSNPLPKFLPHALPPGVKVLCASRPLYPYLSWMEGLDGVRAVDLDGERWAGSNREVVRQYVRRMAAGLVPPLTAVFTSEIVEAAAGNTLYAVKLMEWLQEQPVEKRRVELLPRGLEALLDVSWDQLQRLPGGLRTVALAGLELVAVAREALPLSILAAISQWKKTEDSEFLRVARSFLLEEPGHGGREKAWRPFHESFRSFILSKLGQEREREGHRRLADHLCEWPAKTSDGGFRRNYALRHGVTHWLKAGQQQQAQRLFSDMDYLEEKCRVAGVLSVEDALKHAAVESPEAGRELPKSLYRAVLAESHHLRAAPEALPLLVYNRLRASGWTQTQVEQTLRFPAGLPALRLRHPVRIGRNERTLEGHAKPVTGCIVTPDGRRAVSSSKDKTLKVWDLESGRQLATLEGHSNWVTGCAVTPDGRRAVSTAWDHTLKVWDLESGRELATLVGHREPVTGCAVTPDGRLVVSSSEDKTLKVWDLESGHELATLKGHGSWVMGCAVTPDGRRVVSTSADRTLKVWDLESRRAVAILKGHSNTVTSCVVTPDSRRVVSASEDHTLRVWDLESGHEVAILKGHGRLVTGCAVTPDGRRVVSASDDHTLKVWSLESGREVATLHGHGHSVMGCAVTPDGQRVVSASRDTTLKVWDLEPESQLATLVGHRESVTGCAVTPDGRRVVTSSEDKRLKVWDLESGREVVTLRGHGHSVTGCAVTPDGRRVVTSSEDRTLKVWDLESEREVATLHGHGHSVTGCAVTPDGRHVVSTSKDTTLKVWDLESEREVATLHGHGHSVTGCAVTPDGQHVVSASWDDTLRIWDLDSGREVATLKGHDQPVTACAVTPDGRRVVSASWDDTLEVWDLKSGSEVSTLKGHSDSVEACTVTPDGRRVVSASKDNTLRVWELESGQCLHTLYGVGAFLSVAVTSTVICAGDVFGNVWVLEMESTKPTLTPVPPSMPPSGPTMSIPLPKPVLDAYRSNSLALFIGSGLSLGQGVKGGFPTWSQLPQRLLDACEHFGTLSPQKAQVWRSLFEHRMSLEEMLAQFGPLRTALGRDYPKAIDLIFRPTNIAPGVAHQAVARLGVHAILTTNYDSLIEDAGGTPRRNAYTWKDSDKALRDLESGRHVLLKVHGTAEHHDTVVMTEREYHEAHSDPSYQQVLGYLLQRYTFLFVGYGMNDPLDLDLALKGNAGAFKSAARRHYVLLKDPSDTDRDRYDRDYNVQVIPYSDYAQLPDILESLQRASAP